MKTISFLFQPLLILLEQSSRENERAVDIPPHSTLKRLVASVTRSNRRTNEKSSRHSLSSSTLCHMHYSNPCARNPRTGCRWNAKGRRKGDGPHIYDPGSIRAKACERGPDQAP